MLFVQVKKNTNNYSSLLFYKFIVHQDNAESKANKCVSKHNLCFVIWLLQAWYRLITFRKSFGSQVFERWLQQKLGRMKLFLMPSALKSLRLSTLNWGRGVSAKSRWQNSPCMAVSRSSYNFAQAQKSPAPRFSVLIWGLSVRKASETTSFSILLKSAPRNSRSETFLKRWWAISYCHDIRRKSGPK